MTNFAAFLGALMLFMAALAFDLFALNLEGIEPIQPPPASEAMEPPAFDQLDLDGDELISPNEAAGSWLAGLFDEADLNQDGFVNRAEYAKAIS